ncbi:MAG TPA: hypothetical protein VHE35_05390 [Kofleriaceae bacterium]|nr:hypothetical protein [Kofleriaceae bacterium]
MKLGTLLLRNAAISLSQLETALRSQVLYGGRLGTNLIELGFVDVDALTAAIGELYHLPVATQALLEAVTPATLALVNARTAEALGVIPLGQVASFPDALAVAMIDPRDDATIEELARLTGHTIAPHVVSEARALYYLERLYALPRKARYVRAGTRRVLTDAVERRRTHPAAGSPPPPVPPRVEPERLTAPVVIPPAPPPEPMITFGEAAERLGDATHRDQIAAALLDYAIGRAAALVVFLVRDGNALGWRGYTLEPPAAPISDLGVPLAAAPSLQAAADEGEPYRGPPPASPASPAPPGAAPGEARLWSQLGLAPAAELIVAPIVVRHRAVNLVYAHPLPGTSFSDQVARELLGLCTRASEAYVRLIQRAKST